MKITFIGGGNMASALIGGLLQQNFPMTQIHVVEINAETANRINQQFGVSTTTDLIKGISGSNVIVLAIKPQQLHAVTQALKPLLTSQLVISIAAGVRTRDLSRWLGNYQYIVRAMPNTPALVRAGMTGLYAIPSVSVALRDDATTILGAVGSVLWLEEEDQLDAVTAVSGSGPAYLFYFMEAMEQAGVELGLTLDQARELTIHTFIGASQLAYQSHEDVAVLRSRVTSKGGTTEQALLSMSQDDVKNEIIRAAFAAYKRAQQLGDELGQVDG